jgi:hypothetical protein
MQCPICEQLGLDSPALVKRCKMKEGRPPVWHWRCDQGDSGFVAEAHYRLLDKAGKIYVLDDDQAA